MKKEDQIISVPEDEVDDFYSDNSLFNISSWGADLSFRELITQYEEGDLLKPELQRKYVWDKSEASRFIDSILLGLPVPSIFLAKTSEQKMLIVDGYQRIMTVYDYVRGIFSKDNKIFQLTNSDKINKRWRGKAFNELSDSEQRMIRTTTIHCIIFLQLEPRDDDTSMYLIFERINTSGRTLLPQEIRNCIYQGLFNSLLFELNNNETWRILYGLTQPDTRMRDMEVILRFLALKSDDFKRIRTRQISLKKFLNEFMGSIRSKDEKIINNRREDFLKTIDFVYERFGNHAFHNISLTEPNKVVTKFNPTIFDSIMIASSHVIDKGGLNFHGKADFESKRLKLLQNDDYQDLIRVRTTNVERIKKRISLAAKYLYGEGYE